MSERQPNIKREEISNAINIESKNGKRFRVMSDNSLDIKLKKELIDSLIQQSQNDPLIFENTRDKDRFSSIEVFNEWKEKKNPMIYWLIDDNDKLSGLIWFRKKKNKDSIWDFAIRTYNNGRGAGISLPFMEKSHKELVNYLKNKYKSIKSFHLETNSDNPVAIRIYQKLGYRIRSKKSKTEGNNELYRLQMKLKINHLSNK